MPRAGSVRAVVVGLMAGLVSVTLAVAMASLVFSGPLAQYRAVGIGLALFGTATIGMVTALWSSLPGALAGTQDNTSAIIALASVAAASQVSEDVVLPTVIAIAALTAVALGALLLILGSLRLGRLVRFIPFPVVAGLIAGTGVVIVVFSWDILVGGMGMGSFLETALDGDMAFRWGPGLLITLVLLLLSRGKLRARHAVPVVVLGIAATYVWIGSSGLSIREAQDSGLLLGSFASGPVWTPEVAARMFDADWGAVFGQAGAIGTILLIVPIALLLSVGAIELAVRRDMDGDRELRVAGLGNLAAAVGGGIAGYHFVADTVLAARLAPSNRITSVTASLVVAGVMLGGAPALGVIPTSFIAAILLFIGATFVLEWTWDARDRLPRDDMLVVLLILVVITLVGFLPGVAVGLGLAIVLFAIRSSRLEVVKFEMDGTGYRSRVDRSPEAQAVLAEAGSRILILELQAYLFFGTADRLRTRVEQRISGPQLVDHVILGLRHVTGMDSSALLSFEKLARAAERQHVSVVLAGASPALAAQMERLAVSPAISIASDVDRAVESAEEQLLAETSASPDGSALERYSEISDHFESVTLEAGEHLMTQGEASNGLFLVRSGRVSVQLETESGPVRLRSMGHGALIGEISLYLGGRCTATVVADTQVEALRFSPGNFAAIQREDPATAALLNRLTADVLAQRLQSADQMIEHLLA